MKCLLFALVVSLALQGFGLARATPTTEGNMLPQEVTAALSSPEATLYSLEPLKPPRKSERTFRGYKVLGQMRLSARQEREVAATVRDAVAGYVGYMANCFDPRAAIRVKAGHQTYDLLICYQCNRLVVYKNDVLLSELGVAGSPKVLNNLLSNSKIPISTPIP